MCQYCGQTVPGRRYHPAIPVTSRNTLFLRGQKIIDYRGLNDITIKNRYPLPQFFFFLLDLRNACRLVNSGKEDDWKTAFHTPSSHYKYLVMNWCVISPQLPIPHTSLWWRLMPLIQWALPAIRPGSNVSPLRVLSFTDRKCDQPPPPTF